MGQVSSWLNFVKTKVSENAWPVSARDSYINFEDKHMSITTYEMSLLDAVILKLCTI